MLLPNPPVILLSNRVAYVARRVRMFNEANCFNRDHAVELSLELNDIAEVARCELVPCSERACKLMSDIQELCDAFNSRLISGQIQGHHVELVAKALENIQPRLEALQRFPIPRPHFKHNPKSNIIELIGAQHGKI